MCAPGVEPIRVIVADDAADFRLLLRSMLGLDHRFEIVGEAADGRTLLALLESTVVDAIILDVSMPSFAGLEGIPAVRAKAPGAAVVVISGFDAPRVAAEALRLGATAYVEKGVALDHLVAVLVEAAADPAPLPDGLGAATPLPCELGTALDLDAVLAYLSHELQNPITVVAGLASTLRGSTATLDSDTVKTCVDAIHRNAMKLSVLVRTIVEARAMEGGTFGVVRERVDAGAALGAAAGRLRELAGDRPVVIDVRALEGVEVEMDTRRVLHALDELVCHALLVGAARSAIEITGAASVDAVHLTLRATGDPVDPAIERSRSSTIALVVVAGIIRGHGGQATVTHPAEGGTVFAISLPRRIANL